MGNTDVGMYKQKFNCPIHGCERRSHSQEALTAHLYTDHLKNDIAAALIVMMDLVKDLQTKLRDLSWKSKAHV